MEHTVKIEPEGIVVSLSGDVDLQSSPEVRKILLETVEHKRPVIIDLSGVGYIDSSGIASLVEALQRSRKNGIDLVLASISDAALRVLQLARLDKVFRVYPTLGDALAGFR
ncbi:MAG: STAS domain-containing protein [Rhodospirillales bacterium]|nr:STAS domain-containing protein [Rhodospirillales bacterium]